MNVFLTGATGYIGRVVAEHLRSAGHEVFGLARSDEAAGKLAGAGVHPVRGDLRQTSLLAAGAREAQGVIHVGAEWSSEMGEVDAAAVGAMLGAMAGSGKPFVYTSGTWLMGDTGGKEVSDDAPLNPPEFIAWRPAVEQQVTVAGGRNIRSVVLRPAMVYGRGGGALGDFVRSAKEKGVVKYVGDGTNHWSFVHVEDLASLYVLALDQGAPGAIYVASQGDSLAVREVAAAAARAGNPEAVAEPWPVEEARKVLGPMADPMTMDQRIVATRARESLGWKPEAPGVLAELGPQGSYGG